MRPSLSTDATPERFVSNFRGYLKPTKGDTAVVICHFSPAGFRRPAENARRVVSDMREAGVPIYAVELLRPGRKPDLVSPEMTVSSDSVMFHKENLMNLMLSKVPDRYSKVVFLDADVRFSEKDWVDRVSDALDNADIVQPMEWCFWSSTRSKISAGEQLARGRRLNIGNVHPGFATAARRDWLDRVGGLYDLAVVGNGDACLWDAVARVQGLGFPEGSASPYMSRYDGLGAFADRVRLSSPRVLSLRGCFAGHMPHGTAKKRGYMERHSLLKQDISVVRNADGVYEWVDPSNNGPMLEYFRSRDEDNLTEQETLEPHMDDETRELFIGMVKGARVYVEYGCGGSTVYAFNNSSSKIVCVDSDKEWLDMAFNFMPGRLDRVEACYVNIGEISEWGFPTTPKVDGIAYCSWPWTRTKYADLVLVDGRFRVACTVKTMMEAEPGTPIIFEDYFGKDFSSEGYRRDFYSAVERLAAPESRHGRSALFRVPKSIDRNLAEMVLKRHAKDPR